MESVEERSTRAEQRSTRTEPGEHQGGASGVTMQEQGEHHSFFVFHGCVFVPVTRGKGTATSAWVWPPKISLGKFREVCVSHIHAAANVFVSTAVISGQHLGATAGTELSSRMRVGTGLSLGQGASKLSVEMTLSTF